METLTPEKSPNKRQKTETLTLDSPISPSSIKGKAPITTADSSSSDGGDDDEIPAKLPPRNCGICLSDEGRTVRGLIDSCDHYFCFICIIEWSKIDSRCPLCRGRFSSIRRVRRDGSFIGLGSVPIPVRDQIYDAFGEAVDPYGQAKCSVCNGTKDESLILLCDLCDSASHTYCVGLGATVPEDDWYCHDCDLLRAEQGDNAMCDAVETSGVAERADDVEHVHVDESATTAPVSIFDIVREPSEPRRTSSGTDRLLKLVSESPTKFSSSAIVSDHPSSTSATIVPRSSCNSIARSMGCGPSARTLSKSRDVHRHLSVLRDNWDAFRSGSLSFSTKLSCPSSEVSQKSNVATMSSKGSCKLQVTKSLQSKGQKTSHDVPKKEPSYNVQRAWKLMNAAKSLQPAKKAKGCSKNVPKHTPKLKVDNIVPNCVFSDKKDLTYHNTGLPKPSKKVIESLGQSSGKLQFTSLAPMVASASRSKDKNSRILRSGTTTGAKIVVHTNIYNKLSVATCGEVGRGESSALCDDSACSTSSIRPSLGHSDLSCSYSPRQRISTASCTNPGPFLSKNSSDHHIVAAPSSLQETVAGGSDVCSVKLKEKGVSKYPRKNGTKGNKTSKDGEAKDEISSLVKLNLKLLSKEKRLESETFKEIARLCTHTILASCGFEHRDIVGSVPALVCHHDHQNQRLATSALVPSSCRDCFYTFVNDVVNSIFSEKIN
ncbi:hypothetical protein vseg_013764 [Gypsophila vaccaria]